MANHRRIAAGNVSNFAQMQTWNGAAWVAASGMPAAGDTLHANGFNTVINVNLIDVDIRNDINFNGTTQSGRFEILSAGITYQGTRYARTSVSAPVLYISYGGGTSSVLGDASTTFINSSGAFNPNFCNTLISGQAGGVLYLENTGQTNGNEQGRSVEAINAGNGFEIIALNVTGCNNNNTQRFSAGLLLSGDGYQITATNITPFDVANGGAVSVTGTGNTITINGIARGCNLNAPRAIAVSLSGSGNRVVVNGIAQATPFSHCIAFIGVTWDRLWPTNGANASVVEINGIAVDSNNFSAVFSAAIKLPDTPDDSVWQMKTPTNQDRSLYTAGLLTGYPLESKVEDGTVYGPSSEFEGTMEPWDATFAQALATAQRDLQLPSILSAITAP